MRRAMVLGIILSALAGTGPIWGEEVTPAAAAPIATDPSAGVALPTAGGPALEPGSEEVPEGDEAETSIDDELGKLSEEDRKKREAEMEAQMEQELGSAKAFVCPICAMSSDKRGACPTCNVSLIATDEGQPEPAVEPDSEPGSALDGDTDGGPAADGS